MCVSYIDDKPILTRGYKVLVRERNVLRGEFYTGSNSTPGYKPGIWYRACGSGYTAFDRQYTMIFSVRGYHVFDSLFDAATWAYNVPPWKGTVEIWEVSTRKAVLHGMQYVSVFDGSFPVSIVLQMKLLRRVA